MSENRGKYSWNFSVCRPLFALLTLLLTLVTDSHYAFRLLTLPSLLFAVIADAVAAIDMDRAITLLRIKCAGEPPSCLFAEADDFFGLTALQYMKYRDIAASATLLLLLYLVLFISVATGFTFNRYAYHDLHKGLDQRRNLWIELGKVGFTRKEYVEERKRKGGRSEKVR